MKTYFKKTGENLFCQGWVMHEAARYSTNYDFLQDLAQEVDFAGLWQEKLIATYKGQCSLGAPAYDPIVILKMLFLSYLFGISEREIERVINDSISMKIFLGLALHDPAPKHSVMSKLKKRIYDFEDQMDLVGKEEDIFKSFFDDIVGLGIEKGVEMGVTQAIDSTHTIANVNIQKEEKRQKPLSEGGQKKPPRDKDAKWGVKKKKTVKGKDKNGKETTLKVPEWYYGYKSHLSVNTENDFVTSFHVTGMNAPDNHYAIPLIAEDLAKGVVQPGLSIYGMDRGYDDGEIHVQLAVLKLKDAICLKNVKPEELYKTEGGKQKTKARWTQHTTQEEFELGKRERHVVERVNGDLKEHHTLRRARSLGKRRMSGQTALSCIAHNLKILVREVYGVGLRDRRPRVSLV